VIGFCIQTYHVAVKVELGGDAKPAAPCRYEKVMLVKQMPLVLNSSSYGPHQSRPTPAG
jgi:hypothetical protein